MSSTDDTMVLTAPPTRSTIPLSQADSETFDFDDIQGDVYPSFPKNFEWFFFFTIKNPKAFKADLANFIPKIATAAKTLEALKEISAAKITASNAHESKPTIPLRLYQMALTGKSFYPLGLGATENIRDKYWADGQLVDAYDLGDRPGSESTETKYEPDWDPVWLKHQLHGVILCATHSYGECQLAEIEIKKIFKDSMNIVNIVKGRVRDEPERGHEHFGFNDGISQPAMRGLVNPHPGQLQCDPGVILIGHNGEPNPEASSRAPWTKNSSMMVFRQLKQFVPEFNTFLKKNPTKLEKLTEEQAIALTGAKLFGRFKSGAPIDLVSEIDDPEIGSDPDKNNNFNYQASPLGQTRCPYAAHIRKMAPRFTTNEPLEKVLEQSLIIRAAITYGDELCEMEKIAEQTVEDRGLCFVCYQSFLQTGFIRQQKTWGNSINFPPPEEHDQHRPTPGFDPIIGNGIGSNRSRTMTGTNPEMLSQSLSILTDFVVARGGEYFWVPSISALKMISEGQI